MQRYPILMWYAERFSEALAKPNARLMVIGYGFGDSHINQLIQEAWLKGGQTLTMFIVHPDGQEILRRINPTYGAVSMCRGRLRTSWSTIQPALFGRHSMEAIPVNMICFY